MPRLGATGTGRVLGAALVAQLPVVRAWWGSYSIGDLELEAHVLSDGKRVFTQREMVRLISGGRESGGLKDYIDAIPLEDKVFTAGAVCRFRIPQQPTLSVGYEGIFLIEICEAYLRARDMGLLRGQQEHLGKQAEIITRACAKVGIIAS